MKLDSSGTRDTRNGVLCALLVAGVLVGAPSAYAQTAGPTSPPADPTAADPTRNPAESSPPDVPREVAPPEEEIAPAPPVRRVASPETAAAQAVDATATEPRSTSATASTTSAETTTRPTGLSVSLGGSTPLTLQLHGYFRTRAVSIHNVPVTDSDPARPALAEDANFVYSRLRLEPSLLYGTNTEKPIVALRMQMDGLDNVVWGDNARLARTPLFASDPSYSDIEGFDVPSFKLKRAWLEFLVPIGQLRVGRMPSQWGMGLLTSGSDGLSTDWGDPLFGTTYDRILFATRPLTIANAIAHGDTRETPLVFALAYDKLVEDPLGLRSTPRDPSTRSMSTGGPFSFLSGNGDDVQETVAALAWADPAFNRAVRESDDLAAGLYFVYRTQDATRSNVYILDGFWRLRWSAFGANAPALYTEAEVLTIQGKTRGISLNPTYDAMTGISATDTTANIWGGVFRAGTRAERWDAYLEAGWASGDGLLADDRLTQRPLHPDYHVGLLMYQVALAARSAIALGEELRPLWSRGGVWNSKYLFPQAKLRFPSLGAEVVGAFLLAWADSLSQAFSNERTSGSTACGLVQGDCFLGWEADVAFRMNWGENDLMRWSNEFGVMHAGKALAGVLGEPWLWTIQSRIAIVF